LGTGLEELKTINVTIHPLNPSKGEREEISEGRIQIRPYRNGFGGSEFGVGAHSDAPAFDGEIWWIYPNPRFTVLIVNLLKLLVTAPLFVNLSQGQLISFT
jgi:hypothetical protein